MANIDFAIGTLDREVEQLGNPKEGDPAWWTLLAKSHGASLLRAIQQKQLDNDLTGANNFRKAQRSAMMSDSAAKQATAEHQMTTADVHDPKAAKQDHTELAQP